MLAVFVFMVAFFLAMGGVTAIADALLARKRRAARRAPGSGHRRAPGSGHRVATPDAPRVSSRAEEILLLAEIEEWLKQQR